MDMKKDAGATEGTPVTAPDGSGFGSDRSWVRRNAWSLGSVAAALTLGGFWWRRRRRRQLEVGPVTEAWLEEHEYGAGQMGDQE